jgi:uncharacterized repeat protein (TIGR03803 family)
MKRSCPIYALVLVIVALRAIAQDAATPSVYKILYSFKGAPDAASPWAGVIRDSRGTLYGTTYQGGNSFGTVFTLDPNGKETILYAFGQQEFGNDGTNPFAPLIMDSSGNLYGTTGGGGLFSSGTVFKVDRAGRETVRYSFSGLTDGLIPVAGLLRDTAGNLYGTTVAGGDLGNGTVFKLDKDGTETVLHSFGGPSDGSGPNAGVIRDGQGNFYGTTPDGGGSCSCGIVFKLDASGKETVLHRFTGGKDGAEPYAGVMLDAAGNLYGTTIAGGSFGKGVVFRLDGTGAETVLHSFTGGTDGASPYGTPIRDAMGNLYGTTAGGGRSGKGTVFRLDKAGRLSVLHSFAGGSDGANPNAGVYRDTLGNLYGTTLFGGAANAGVVFKITP